MDSVVVRKVWKENLVEEFELVKVALRSHRTVSIDTEFPGVVYRPANVDGHDLGKLPPNWNYQVIRDNVNSTNIIQLGLALCDDKGCLPDFGTECQYVWEFNFKDFDVYNDLQNPESIELLERQGIDFDKNLKEGIESADFAALILDSGLLGNHHSAFTWVTFHGAYDIAHLMKILIRRPLPYDLTRFMIMVQSIFGKRLFDLKHMMKFCDGLYGGLEKVANALGVQRLAGKSHQAGSDTLLTLQTFKKFLDVYFIEQNNGGRGVRYNGHLLTKMQCVLHGLELNDGFHQWNNAGLKINNPFSHGFRRLNLNSAGLKMINPHQLNSAGLKIIYPFSHGFRRLNLNLCRQTSAICN
ncbi:hypothetical protein ACB098_04G126900 [Castanea mollissima]